MHTIRPGMSHLLTLNQLLNTPVVSGSKNGKLGALLGLSGGHAPNSARYMSTEALHSIGFMSRRNSSPFASMKRVNSMTSAITEGAEQKRNKFTLVNFEQFEQIKRDKPLEFVGLHGTAGFAMEGMKDGIDPNLPGKYTGGRSAGGKGIYTTNSDAATAPEQAVDAQKAADHYAWRATLGESMAFDLDTSRKILAFYRVPTQNLKREPMPAEIQGKADKVAAFREQHPAHEYDLGQTPVPRRLSGVQANTTLISDQALADDEAEYYAVEFKPKD